MKKKLLVLCWFAFFLVNAQPLNQKKEFTKQDSLRGSNNEFRNWWDVKKYDLTIKPNFDERSIKGGINIAFKVLELPENKVLQIDLQEPMQIDQVGFKTGNTVSDIRGVSFKREKNVYFIDLNNFPFKKDEVRNVRISFSGKPKIAKNPPWDGGWIFTKDKKGRPWMSVACQGLGASVWFPNKDYLGDEPEQGMQLSILTPMNQNLMAVGNGKLLNQPTGYALLGNQEFTNYTWLVQNPINNYNMVPYIGNYVNFKDNYQGENGNLELSYWVLDYNLEKAKKHFKQTKQALKTFEKWFGPYPFYEDSFKLVESPYLGMEHQSNIAYGNQYVNGYLGNDLSGTGNGLQWDFIIVHEAGHEWFGNSITAKDIADMWVHEAFTHYSEVLHTQELLGKEAGDAYARGLFNNILNDIPVVGIYGVNQEGSGDMYAKGAAMIHTLRQLIEDDDVFKQLLRQMNKKFYHKTVTTKEIEDFMSEFINKDLSSFFNQYLRTIKVPQLQLRNNTIDNRLEFKYANVVADFNMPLKLANNEWIFPNQEWKEYQGKMDFLSFAVNPNFYVELSKTSLLQEPAKTK